MIEIKAKSGFATNRLENLYIAMIENKFTDVVFIVENRSFYAHLVVLAACSEFFTKNKNNLSAVFSGFEYPVIQAILKYCYTGNTNIEDKYLKKFTELAEKLQISFKAIDQTNCFEVLILSDDPKSKETALDFTVENFKTLYKTSGFTSIPASIFADILKSEKLGVSIETIFKAIKLWVNSDTENRKSELVNLLSLVTLPSSSIEFFTSTVLEVCQSFPECSEFIKQAIISMQINCQSLNPTEENVNGDKIALVGDWNSFTANRIEIYDGKRSIWITSKDFKFLRSDFASVLVNNWILIIGGYSKSNQVNYIDLKNGHKRSLTPLNQARFYFSAVAVRHDSSTDVFVIGGYGNEILSTVERWNSRLKTWEYVAPLLQPVYFHSASVIDDKIYVTGGRTKNDEMELSTNDVQVYSTKSNSWSYCAPMIHRRDQHSSVTIKGKLCVGGGFILQTTTRLDSVELFDPIANIWTSYCRLPNPAEGISLCYFRNKLLCIGGFNLTSLTNVWEYDEKHDNWNAFKNLNNSRVRSNAIVIPYDSTI